jgi:hypothetical protein
MNIMMRNITPVNKITRMWTDSNIKVSITLFFIAVMAIFFNAKEKKQQRKLKQEQQQMMLKMDTTIVNK